MTNSGYRSNCDYHSFVYLFMELVMLPMEKDFEQKDYTDYFNIFMRDFLTLKIGRIPNMREVYSEFKSYMISNKSKPIYETVKEIRDYSRLFVKLAYAKEENPQLRQVINDINELEVEVSYPFLMHIFKVLFNYRI